MAKVHAPVPWRATLAIAITMWAGYLYLFWNRSSVTDTPSLPDIKDLSYHHINAQLEALQGTAEAIPGKRTISWIDFIRRADAKHERGAHELIEAENIALLRSVLARCSVGQTAAAHCAGAWDASYLAKWLNGRTKDSDALCETNADSAILVLDSPSPSSARSAASRDDPRRLGAPPRPQSSRFLSLSHAMLDLNKIREQSGRREFEVGLISASCGASAPEEIIGLPLYVPDIANQHCDYVFDEPVLLVSHDSNSMHGGKALRDAYAVYTALLLAGYGTISHAKKVTLLNMQGLLMQASSKRKNAVVNDKEEWSKPRNYHYRKLFRRVLGAGDFPPGQRLCFKQLIVLTKPPQMIPWGGRGRPEKKGSNSSISASCLPKTGSVLARQFNVQMRQVHQLLPSVHHKQTLPAVTDKKLHVILTLPTGFGSAAANYALAVKAELEDLILDLGQDADYVQVSSVDFANLSMPDQVYVAGNASILVGLSGGDALWSAAFMPLGTGLCCGIVELDAPAVAFHSFEPLAGFLGIHYGSAQVKLPKTIGQAVLEVARKLHEKPSCV